MSSSWVTLYRIAFAPARKLYRVELLFTHCNGDFSAISVTERRYAAPISKVASHILDRCLYNTKYIRFIQYSMNIGLVVSSYRRESSMYQMCLLYLLVIRREFTNLNSPSRCCSSAVILPTGRRNLAKIKRQFLCKIYRETNSALDLW